MMTFTQAVWLVVIGFGTGCLCLAVGVAVLLHAIRREDRHVKGLPGDRRQRPQTLHTIAKVFLILAFLALAQACATGIFVMYVYHTELYRTLRSGMARPLTIVTAT